MFQIRGPDHEKTKSSLDECDRLEMLYKNALAEHQHRQQQQSRDAHHGDTEGAEGLEVSDTQQTLVVQLDTTDDDTPDVPPVIL